MLDDPERICVIRHAAPTIFLVPTLAVQAPHLDVGAGELLDDLNPDAQAGFHVARPPIPDQAGVIIVVFSRPFPDVIKVGDRHSPCE